MTISLEALAMSGADFLEVGFNIEEWEEMNSEIPLYLIEEDDEKEKKRVKGNDLYYERSSPSLPYEDLEDENEDGRDEESEICPKEKCWSFMNQKKNMCVLIIIIWTIVRILIEKIRKTRSLLR